MLLEFSLISSFSESPTYPQGDRSADGAGGAGCPCQRRKKPVSHDWYDDRLAQGGLCGRQTGTFSGHARCSTDRQDLAAQRVALRTLGWPPSGSMSTMACRGPTARAGLDQALTAVRAGGHAGGPSATAPPVRFPTPAPSPTGFLRADCGFSWEPASTIRTTPRAGCPSTCWPPSPSSRPT